MHWDKGEGGGHVERLPRIYVTVGAWTLLQLESGALPGDGGDAAPAQGDAPAAGAEQAPAEAPVEAPAE